MSAAYQTTDYKPRWLIEREEKRDNKWLDGGSYSFICDHCTEVVSVKLRPVKRYRTHFMCPKCKARNRL